MTTGNTIDPGNPPPITAPPVGEGNELGWQGCPTTMVPAVQQKLEQLRAYEVFLLTKHYWVASDGYNVDFNKLQDRLRDGLPNGCNRGTPHLPLDYSGWIAVDIEAPWWAPFRAPNQHTDLEALQASMVYLSVIGALKRLRPQAKLSLYNMTHLSADSGYSFRYQLLEIIHSQVHGASPSIYRHWHPMQQDFNITNTRVQNAFVFKEQFDIPIHGWTWWKRQGGDGAILTIDELRQWLGLWKDMPWSGWWMLGGDKPESMDLAMVARHLLGT